MKFLNQKSTAVTTELTKLVLHLTQSPFHNDPDWEYLRKISAITKSINSVLSSVGTYEKSCTSVPSDFRDKYKRFADNILFHELAHYQDEDQLNYYKNTGDFLLVNLYCATNDKILKEIQVQSLSEAGDLISTFLVICLNGIADYSKIISEISNREEVKNLALEAINISALGLIEINHIQKH